MLIILLWYKYQWSNNYLIISCCDLFSLPHCYNQGHRGCWTLLTRSAGQTGVHLGRVAAYTQFRFSNQLKACLLHTFGIGKSKQTQVNHLTDPLNMFLSVTQKLSKTYSWKFIFECVRACVSSGEKLGQTPRCCCRCKNVNISTCRPLACRTWLRHCLTGFVANDKLSWLPASEEAVVSKDFCGSFQ